MRGAARRESRCSRTFVGASLNGYPLNRELGYANTSGSQGSKTRSPNALARGKRAHSVPVGCKAPTRKLFASLPLQQKCGERREPIALNPDMAGTPIIGLPVAP